MKRLVLITVSALFLSAALAVQVLVQGNGVRIQGDGVFLGLGPTNAVSWTPETVTNTVLQWFRSDDLAGVGGSSIITWPAHIYGNNGSNPGGPYSPTLRIYGGLPWQRYAEFDGVANYIATGDWTTSGYEPPFTWAIAFRKRYSENPLQVLMSSNGSDVMYSYITDDNSTYDFYAGFLNGTGPASTDTTIWHMLIVQWNSGFTNLTYSFDGSPMTNTVQNNLGGIPLWGVVLGIHGDLVDYAGAYDIAGLIVWKDTLNIANLIGLGGYFTNQWR